MGEVRIPVVGISVSKRETGFSVLKGRNLKARGIAPGSGNVFRIVRVEMCASEQPKIRTKWSTNNFRTNNLFHSVRNQGVALYPVFSRAVFYSPLFTRGVTPGYHIQALQAKNTVSY